MWTWGPFQMSLLALPSHEHAGHFSASSVWVAQGRALGSGEVGLTGSCCQLSINSRKQSCLACSLGARVVGKAKLRDWKLAAFCREKSAQPSPVPSCAWAHQCPWCYGPRSRFHSKPQSVQLLFQEGSNKIYIQSKTSRKGE